MGNEKLRRSGTQGEIKLLSDEQGIHILALNETELDTSIPKRLTEISGCQQKRLDRTCNGDGVAFT